MWLNMFLFIRAKSGRKKSPFQKQIEKANTLFRGAERIKDRTKREERLKALMQAGVLGLEIGIRDTSKVDNVLRALGKINIRSTKMEDFAKELQKIGNLDHIKGNPYKSSLFDALEYAGVIRTEDEKGGAGRLRKISYLNEKALDEIIRSGIIKRGKPIVKKTQMNEELLLSGKEKLKEIRKKRREEEQKWG